MKFIYTTDLHGSVEKYEAVFRFAVKHDVKLLHIGADILPKGSDILKIQEKFVKGYLKKYYQKCKDAGIDILAFFGNDDIYTRKKYFKKYASLLDEVPYQKEGYEFKAYPYVQDYPFPLKTACKLESKDWVCPDPYKGNPVDVGASGIEKIPDIKKYFSEKGTIEEDLKHIHANNKTIMAIHQPPSDLNLDVCARALFLEDHLIIVPGRRVGSRIVFNWIKLEQPLLCLCGHIHENYEVTKTWMANIDKTLVIQPGQHNKLTTFVLIEITENSVKTSFHQI